MISLTDSLPDLFVKSLAYKAGRFHDIGELLIRGVEPVFKVGERVLHPLARYQGAVQLTTPATVINHENKNQQ
jgi:hypothetical protein